MCIKELSVSASSQRQGAVCKVAVQIHPSMLRAHTHTHTPENPTRLVLFDARSLSVCQRDIKPNHVVFQTLTVRSEVRCLREYTLGLLITAAPG